MKIMRSQKVTFSNAEGVSLSARLEMPVDQHPHAYAIFAHCFTCNKNLTAVRNISRSLTSNGIAVLGLDFTGLGESEGNFSDTNFSTNVDDLVQAAIFLGREYTPPSILIGHSLGGAAVIAASARIESIKAVATIGAPSDPSHVGHLFASGRSDLKEKGFAEINIGGRPFTIKQQFVQDIQEQDLNQTLRTSGKALLIMHSPQDRVVEIENAARLYESARHPKSFITLDGADHLLSNKKDSQYAGEIIGCWSKKYVQVPVGAALRSNHPVAVRLHAEDGYTTQISVRQHGLIADEPEEVGGNDFGPGPYEFVSSGLGACTAMTLHMYARRKKWDLKEVRVHLEHHKDYATDCHDCDRPQSKIDFFDRILEIEGDLDDAQRSRLLEIADRCPVHRTLTGKVEIRTKLAP